MKRLLAALLCGTVIVSSGNFTPTVYAAEQVAENGIALEEVPEEIDSDTDGEVSESDDDSNAASDENSEEETGEDSSENKEGASDEETDDVEDETSEESDEEEAIEDDAESEEGEEKPADEKAEGKELPKGIKGLPEGFDVPSEHKSMKRNARSHDVLSAFEVLKEGTDYVPGEVVTLADSREEAEIYAEAYSGELVEYSYGVATISLADSVLSVNEAFEYALDKDLDLPYLEPNYISKVEEPVEEEDVEEESELFSAGEDDVAAGRGFSDWWYGTDNPDPYLNPENGTYQWHHGMINSYSAWGVTTGDRDIVVAVIDSGVNASHSDFVRSDGSKVVNTSAGWNFADGGDGNANTEDVNGHGTHVAGIIAAALNGKLGAGVAPDVTILPVRICDPDGSYSNADLLKAILYVVGLNKDGTRSSSRRADIVNMSLGSYSPNHSDETISFTLEEVINIAYLEGCTLVAAMGNNKNSNTMEWPAAFDKTIAVSSVNENGLVSWFSSTGSWADIASPGSEIYSCDASNNSAYVYDSGTSMAAPVVAGACALYMSAVGHVDPDTMKRVLKSAVTGSAGSGTGAGILDLAKLFNGDTTAPRITLIANNVSRTKLGEVQDGKSYTVTSDIAPNSKIEITPLNFGGEEGANDNTRIVYTTDGKAPSVYNGEIVSGNLYDASRGIEIRNIIGTGTTSKTKVTVKAAAVTGMGVMGKVSTLIFTVDPNLWTDEMDISTHSVEILNCPTNLVAGKSVKLEAIVTSSDPDIEVSQKVVWRIEGYKDGDLSKAKINASTGALTTAATQYGRLTISCTSADGRAKATATIVVTDLKPVNTMVLNGGNAVELSVDTGASKDVSLTKLTDINGNDMIANGYYQFVSTRWTSSNENVVSVAAYNYDPSNPKPPTAKLTPVGVGTATVTVYDLNGSSKSAKITVKVTSARKAEAVKICEVGAESEGITALTMNVLNAPSRTGLRAYCSYDGTFTDPIAEPVWKSSNPKIVKVVKASSDGSIAQLIALTKGSATITCQANDGSGKSATVKVTVQQVATMVGISGPESVIAGSNTKYTATVLPSTAANKQVEWYLRDQPWYVTISNGVLTVPDDIPAGTEFYVCAKLVDNDDAVDELAVKVVSEKAKQVTMVVAEPELPSDKPSEAKVELLHYAYFVGTADNGAYVEYKSSNPKVMAWEETEYVGGGTTGVFRAVGTGTCKITATATDGSKKSATMTVKVVRLAESVEVTGQSSIAVGNKATFKATVLPANATDKKVTWSFVSAVDGVSVDPNKGIVTVDKTAPVGYEVKLKATAQDGSEEYGTITFKTTSEKVSSVVIGTSVSTNDPARIPSYNKGTLSSFRLYDTNIVNVDSAGNIQNTVDESSILLYSSVTVGGNLSSDAGVVWSSSNEKVAEVVDAGLGKAQVVAKKAGAATITCTAGDGSGKKASAKVTVITPASGVFVTAGKTMSQYFKRSKMNDKLFYLGYGASMPLSIKVGDAYGKPGISKTNVTYEIGKLDENENFLPFKDEYQDTIKRNKWYLSCTGSKVSFKSKSAYRSDLKKEGLSYTATDYELHFNFYTAVRVTVTTTDGTGFSDTAVFRAVFPNSKIQVRQYSGSRYTAYDGSIIDITHNTPGEYIIGAICSDGWVYDEFTVTSSNPNIVSVRVEKMKDYESWGGGYMLLADVKKKGTVTVTISSLDGTGKKKTYKIMVK